MIGFDSIFPRKNAEIDPLLKVSIAGFGGFRGPIM